MKDVKLQFGLKCAIPATVTTAWGARFIFPDDMLPDRQDVSGPDMETLKRWLNTGAIRTAREAARKAADRGVITSHGSQKVILHQDETGIIVACPNSSYGYLYVAGWLHNGEALLLPAAEYKAIPPKPVTPKITCPPDGTKGKCGTCGRRRVVAIVKDGKNVCNSCFY